MSKLKTTKNGNGKIFLIFSQKHLEFIKKIHTFALAFKKYGSVAQLNRASDYGSEGYRFESYRSHKRFHENCKEIKIGKEDVIHLTSSFSVYYRHCAAAYNIHLYCRLE